MWHRGKTLPKHFSWVNVWSPLSARADIIALLLLFSEKFFKHNNGVSVHLLANKQISRKLFPLHHPSPMSSGMWVSQSVVAVAYFQEWDTSRRKSRQMNHKSSIDDHYATQYTNGFTFFFKKLPPSKRLYRLSWMPSLPNNCRAVGNEWSPIDFIFSRSLFVQKSVTA